MNTWGKESISGVKYSLNEGRMGFQMATHAAFAAVRKVFIER